MRMALHHRLDLRKGSHAVIVLILFIGFPMLAQAYGAPAWVGFLIFFVLLPGMLIEAEIKKSVEESLKKTRNDTYGTARLTRGSI